MTPCKMKNRQYLITCLWLILSLVGVLVNAVTPVTAYGQSEEKAVIYLFWGDGCPHCAVAKPALEDLALQYPDAELRTYEVWYDDENKQNFIQMAKSFGFEPRFVPTIFLGERYWEGFSEEVLMEIEITLASCLEKGCRDAGSGIISPSGRPYQPTNVQMQSNDFTLAMVVIVGMAAALVYSGIYLKRGLSETKRVKSEKYTLGFWLNLSFIGLCLLGLGIATYLAYIETQSVPAVCGPVGDCNAVQSSSYARLFGLLPIGVLGMLGYLAVLAAWLYPRIWHNRLAKVMPMAVFGMTAFGVLFSLYLTFLEPFVIRAVCAWCITSSVIMTLLMLLSLKPARQSIQKLKK